MKKAGKKPTAQELRRSKAVLAAYKRKQLTRNRLRGYSKGSITRNDELFNSKKSESQKTGVHTKTCVPISFEERGFTV